ncbi:MAG: hypothetical protein M0C28_33735 [Candidatus Moduliflexus flocculans]|nr:hypothetical protein [Candidatus Moduliflexus flocculans]
MLQANPIFDAAGQTYQQTRISHWDAIARKRDAWRGMGSWYHRRLAGDLRLPRRAQPARPRNRLWRRTPPCRPQACVRRWYRLLTRK